MDKSINHTMPNATLMREDNLFEAWSLLIDAIAHNITTPLVTMRMNNDVLLKLLPELEEGYRLAVENNLLTPKIHVKHLKLIKENFFADPQQQIQKLIDFLESLRLLKNELPSTTENHQSLSAKQMINNILNNYPFINEQRNLIMMEENDDFMFHCSPLVIEALFINLLSNAIRSIENAKKGKIRIWMSTDNRYHMLHFKDTAEGMNNSLYKQIFHRFFSKNKNKITPGLGFCRLALLQAGGDVICESKLGEYTHFKIMFPKIKTQ